MSHAVPLPGSEYRVCLFEEPAVEQLEPLTLTRPAFDLLCGQTSLAAKQCRHFAPCAVGLLVRPVWLVLTRLLPQSLHTRLRRAETLARHTGQPALANEARRLRLGLRNRPTS